MLQRPIFGTPGLDDRGKGLDRLLHRRRVAQCVRHVRGDAPASQALQGGLQLALHVVSVECNTRHALHAGGCDLGGDADPTRKFGRLAREPGAAGRLAFAVGIPFGGVQHRAQPRVPRPEPDLDKQITATA